MKTITSNRLISFFVIVILCGVSALVLTSTASSEGPKNLGAGRAKEAIRMFDIGMGHHAFNFQLGRETKTQYLGSAEMRQLAQSQQAQPRSMVSDDFNGDGMGDLVIGYANGNGGMLGLRHGNLQAIAPTDKEVFDGIGQGRSPSPFLTEVTLYSLPEAPDFLQVGDFDSDGYADVMAAARGSQRMYLLSGDGHGQLKQAKAFEVGGLVTAMQAGREQRGRFTSLALGLNVPGGSTLSVYQEGGDGLASDPQSYTMPSEVTALAYGDLNQDGTPDVAAAARNEVAVVYQNANGAVDGPPPNDSDVERTTFPFNVRGLTVGNFVFDRGHQMELALLSDDGAIHLADKGSPDRREFTAAEIEFMRQQRIAWHKGQQDMDALTREMNKLVSKASKDAAQGAWKVTETLNSGAAPPFSGAPGLLQTAKMSGLSLDDLLVGNDADNSVQVVKNKQDVLKLKFKDAEKAAATTSVKVEGAPLAAVSIRLSVNALPGIVILQAGQIEPLISINSVSTAYTTTTFTDHPITPGVGGVNVNTGQIVGGAGNGLVSIRSAIVASNYKGGSNTIAVANGTHTLTQGPWDDEFNTFGAVMESGDLDIIDLSFGGFPLLTAVAINGGGRDTTIIQMGTLVPGAGGISKDRVIESNNFVIPQHGTSVTFTNLTIQNGNAPRTPAPDNYNTKGGGIQFDGFDSPSATNLGVLTLTNTKFATNTSAGQGGGVLAIFGGLTVQSTSIVSGNTTTFAAGGGIQHSGGNVITTTFTIDNSTIGGATVGEGNTANDASFGSGGGVDSVGANAFNITGGSIIRNNVSGVLSGPNGGGGVHIGNSKNIVFSTSSINENKAKHNGGGIWVSARDAVTNAASTITMTTMNVNTNQADSDNTLVGDGGGLYTFFGNATVQTTSHIDGNSANNGGGIFTGWTGIAGDSTPALTVQSNSTIGQAGAGNGNSAKNNGGALAMNPGAATTFGAINLNTLTFTNSTANSDNAGGGDGGAIFVGTGNITSLNNCTIDSNVANSGTGDGIFMAGGTITAAGTLTLAGDDSININGGTFTSTAGTFNLAGNFTRSTGGTFTHNGGTLNFNGTGAQSINGTATTDNFNNFTVNKGGGTLTVGGSRISLTIAANTTLTAGTFAAGTAATITMSGNGGNWTNNGGTFTPGSGIVSFTNTVGAQAINGSAASQTFNSITVAKTAQTLSVAGSTTALTLNGTMLLTSGTFAAGTAANINVGGNWTNNGGTFTPGTGLVTFNGGAAQNLNGTAATQTFNNFGVNKGGGTLTVGGSTTTLNVNGTTLTAGTFAAGTATTINSSGDWTNNGGTFTPGTGTVNFNNTAAAQNLNGSNASQTFNNITVAKTAQTLTGAGSLATLTLNGTMLLTSGTFAAGTITSIPIAGNWTNNGATFTPGSSNVTFNNAGAAQSINGTAATQTFNSLTVSKTGQTLSGAASTTTLTLNANFSITAGTFAVGTITTMNVAGNWGNTGTFTPGASTVILNGNNNTQTLTGTTSFNNLTANHTGTGGVTASGSTLTVTGLFRIQAGTFTSSSTFNNVQIDSGATLASDGSTMNVSGNWTNNGGTFTPSTGTVNFNGGGAQAINGTAASQTFNNFIVNKSGGTLSAGGSTTSITTNDFTMTLGTFTAPATLDINGNTLLTAGTLTAGANITAAGNWTRNGGTFTPGASTVTFDGVATQTIGGTTATTFNSLTNSNAAGITMANDNTVNTALALSAGDISVQATKTLTQPASATSSGNFDVNGRVQRNGFVTGGAALTFGNPFNTIQVTAGTAPANIVVDLARNVPVGFAGAVQRTYTITPSAGGFTGTLRLHYLDAELNGNTEASMILRRFNGTGWAPVAPTSSDTTNNWLEATGVTTFSPWTMSSCCLPTGSSGAISGRITTPDGRPVEGAVVNLGGDQSRKTITDANGNYHFEEVGTGGFYTVTPSRANFSFAPFSRNFSQSGNQTEAVFTGDPASDTANPLDTAEYFVRQQYVDVLGREPEEAGFNYWSDKILACGADAGCVSSMRREVAAAFFIAEENQASGVYIYDAYSGALGRRPAFSEFTVDRTQVVGGATLDADKTAFAQSFVQRAEFMTRYQNANSADAFVDALLQSVQATGANLSGERSNLIGIYGQGADQISSRAAVLRSIADNATFKQSQYNPAFVLTEYFAYLRRDAEPEGFNFWVGVLTNGGGGAAGNYRGMVCSFVTAAEYQNRFSQIVSHSNSECSGQ